MLDAIQISRLLEELQIRTAGEIIQPSAPGESYFVFIPVTRDSDNRQLPTNRRLQEAKAVLLDAGATVEFLLTDEQTHDIEAGLRATLLHSFADDVRNVFLSLGADSARVWIEPKRALEGLVVAEMRAKAQVYLDELDCRLESLDTTTGENLPSVLACLRAIRHSAPVTTTELRDELIRRGFSIPSPGWLVRRLDAMRRSGKIVWVNHGKYALSLQTLQELGTVKGRSSPDISRLLALARNRQ
ncbi:hypothetical protein [Paraburkholderia sp. BCC1876]|uniref:hypothetical protein n=1 Tax=Paraburkholderia sp. BCC1876 TaxID=2676303 RepID=UPI00159074C0|nr:hypothetical protein [Paraburkholderia sp. BCC1876]